MSTSVATDLYSDASGGSIGAVLQQTDKAGVVRPAGFYSRALTPSEQHYGTYDRELVGLRDSCLHFRYNFWVFLSRFNFRKENFDQAQMWISTISRCTRGSYYLLF